MNIFHAEGVLNFPHPGGCDDCRVERQCNCCGVAITATTRCTNGRCHNCHVHVCTPGGTVAPGHGYGTREEQIKWCDDNRKLFGLPEVRR